jgi:uncharacterized protein (TIGR01777 family)
MMQTILITGGTGMVGRHLTKHLTGKGYKVIILTRKMPAAVLPDSTISFALWDVEKKTIDINAVQQADFIVHLAGAGVVDKKWTDSYKAEIVNSRTASSALLIETLQNNAHSVKAIVSASAIGWYGADPAPGINGFVETDEPANGFLGETCKLWEQSISPAEAFNIRVVKIRIGIVLSKDGGALAEFKKPIQFGVAGILGEGTQVVSWIHIEDLCRIFTAAIENTQMSGSYNAVAPAPVTNKALTLELAKQIKGKFFIPMNVPEFVLKIMLGDRSIEVLKSATVSCEKILATGFTFEFPSIDKALAELTLN